MHIPLCETSVLEILPFETALNPTQNSYDRQKWLYVPDFYAEYRYLLGTRGKKPLICIGINPSTAAPDALDNTLKSVERIALSNGFDSFLMCNVYAQRATRPDDLDREHNALLHAENMKAFRWILEQAEPTSPPSVWAAWGTILEKRPFLIDCVRDMHRIGEDCNARWLCAGKLSKKGHPHHPLYLRKEEPLRPFDLEGYLNTV